MKYKTRIFFGTMAFVFLSACIAPQGKEAQKNVPAETGTAKVAAVSHGELTVDYLKETGAFDHFWQAAGSPRLGKPEEFQVYSYLASVPHQGIRVIRIQNLFKMAQATNVDDGGYDWSRIMYLIQYLVDHDLEPFFCLSAFPEGERFDFENLDDVRKWYGLIRAL